MQYVLHVHSFDVMQHVARLRGCRGCQLPRLALRRAKRQHRQAIRAIRVLWHGADRANQPSGMQAADFSRAAAQLSTSFGNFRQQTFQMYW